MRTGVSELILAVVPSIGDASTSPNRSIAWIIIGVITVLCSIGLGHTLRRRARRQQSASHDRLVEAGRRMNRASDLDEISRIAAVEARAIADADHVVFVDVHPERMTLAGDADAIFESRGLDQGILRRVVRTGEPLNTVIHDEAWVTALPAAMLAVPVMAERRVGGMMVLIRPQERPFTTTEADLVARFAPLVGAAAAACRRNDDLAAVTLTDALTGLPNRRRFDLDLSTLSTGRTNELYAIAVIDIDHFTHFNGEHGHAAGDTALRAVAEAVTGAVAPEGTTYRYDGEAFGLILRVESPREATAIVHRARQAVERLDVTGADDRRGGVLTISAGVAVLSGLTPRAALAAAGAALYTAKQNGRNRVEMAETGTTIGGAPVRGDSGPWDRSA